MIKILKNEKTHMPNAEIFLFNYKTWTTLQFLYPSLFHVSTVVFTSDLFLNLQNKNLVMYLKYAIIFTDIFIYRKVKSKFQ